MDKDVEFKFCNKCGVLKPLTDFYYRKDTGKYRPTCKRCKNTLDAEQKKKRREYNKSQWQKNKDKRTKQYREWYDKRYYDTDQVERRRSHNYKKYGLSSEEYMEMYKKNEGKCYICNQPEIIKRKGKVKRLAIDHCHSTGKVRGLLCQNCNRGLGLLKDNIEVLENAIKYLKESK